MSKQFWLTLSLLLHESKPKYTNPANPVRNFCKQKLWPLPEFPGVLCNVLGVLHNILTCADTFQTSCGDQDYETTKPNKAISCIRRRGLIFTGVALAIGYKYILKIPRGTISLDALDTYWTRTGHVLYHFIKSATVPYSCTVLYRTVYK